jgi:hypothetical protein
MQDCLRTNVRRGRLTPAVPRFYCARFDAAADYGCSLYIPYALPTLQHRLLPSCLIFA